MPSVRQSWRNLRSRYQSARNLRYLRSQHKEVYAALERHDDSIRAELLSLFIQTGSVFVHVPKAAGISVCHALYRGISLGHPTASYYHEILGSELFSKLYKFAFVREPTERFLSAYAFLAKGGINERDKHFAETVIQPNGDINSFILDYLDENRIEEQLHFKPQVRFLCDSNGHFLMDFIGRFETLNEDFQKVAQHIGYKVMLPSYNTNKTKLKNPSTTLSSESLTKVRRLYEEDYRRYFS